MSINWEAVKPALWTGRRRSGRRHVPNAKHGVDLQVPSTCWPYGASVPSGRARERLLPILCILLPAARTSEHIFEI
jgi:hypothetical protein